MSTLKRTTMHPRLILKNEGSKVQTCRYMNVNIINTDIQGVLILCAQKLTTYKIIIGEHCAVILFVKFWFL